MASKYGLCFDLISLYTPVGIMSSAQASTACFMRKHPVAMTCTAVGAIGQCAA